MTPFALSAAAVFAQAAAVADTVVTVQASSTGLQRWVDLLTSIASIVIALALIALALAVIPAAWNSRKLYLRINRALESAHTDVRPILRHMEAVAENVDYVSTAIRQDVAEFKRTLDAAQTRLDRAAALAEERIAQFNGLLEVVQEEAEELFIDTASTIRGVKAGARALREPGPELAWDDDGDEDEPRAGPPPRPRTHP